MTGNTPCSRQLKFFEKPDRSKGKKCIIKSTAPPAGYGNTQQTYSITGTKRNTLAHNAGFKSYTDYRFKELGRFDYTKRPASCFAECRSSMCCRWWMKFTAGKKAKLGYVTPWDVDAEPKAHNLLRHLKRRRAAAKSIAGPGLYWPCARFWRLPPTKMNQLKHLDLESRKGKAPGGYNCRWQKAAHHLFLWMP